MLLLKEFYFDCGIENSKCVQGEYIIQMKCEYFLLLSDDFEKCCRSFCL